LLSLSGLLGLDIDAQSVLRECYPLLIGMIGFYPWQESRFEPSKMTTGSLCSFCRFTLSS